MKDLLTIDNITRVYKIQMSCTANLPDNLYYNITDTSRASLKKVVFFTLEPDVPFNLSMGLI